MSSNPDMPVNVRLSHEELTQLQAIAEMKRRSRGDVMRRLIRLGLPSAHLTIPVKDTGGDVRPVSAA